MEKPNKFDTFFYRHFKRNGNSPSKILIQPVEKIIYDPNSSTRFKNIKRHETELKWIRFLQSPFPLGFNDNIYHEGNVSKMPDLDYFLFWNVKNVKVDLMVNVINGNIKRKICTEKRLTTSLKDLSLALTKYGRHGLFSFLSSLPILVLRNLELEANKLYNRTNRLYKAALLTRCYVQHFLSPYIDSEVKHKQLLIKIPLINKGIEFIDLHSIFKDNLVISSIPNYFNNSETPIICYKYNKPIRSTIFNFNKIVNDIDIDSNTPASSDCQNSNYLYPSAGHIITGNLNVIPDARVRNIISKGPKYRFPSNIDFSKCRREIAASLNDFSNPWCKREKVEHDALTEWKTSLTPKPKLSFHHLKRGIQDFHMNYALVPADKAANKVVVV